MHGTRTFNGRMKKMKAPKEAKSMGAPLAVFVRPTGCLVMKVRSTYVCFIVHPNPSRLETILNEPSFHFFSVKSL